MLLQILFLSITLSIDALGIGITYGLRDIKINTIAKIILFISSVAISSLSICVGTFLLNIIPSYLLKLISPLILIIMGYIVIYQSLKEENENITIKKRKSKTYSFFLRPLGITINIIRDGKNSDLNHSNTIEPLEALYLSLALSIDCIGVTIASTVVGISSHFFPFFIASFQLIFLLFGTYIAKKFLLKKNVSTKIYTIASGILLIVFGFLKIFS